MLSPYSSLPDFKAGGVFSQVGTTVLPAGTWSATCQLRHRDTRALVGTIVIALGTSVGEFTPFALTATSTETKTWHAGGLPVPCIFDIRFTDQQGNVVFSDTEGLRVTSPITEPAA